VAVDRLGWAAGVSFESYGLRIGLRVSDPAVLGRAVECLPPGWTRGRSPVVDQLYSLVVGGHDGGSRPRRFHLLYTAASRIARTLDLEEALAVLESDLKMHVAEKAHGRVFVHAGVVAHRGRTILLPGRSHSGKSRLVDALVRAGCTYYSDEFAVLDARGRVHAYPAPLTLRGEDGAPPRRLQLPGSGGRGARPALPVGLVVVSRYRPEARWRPRRISPGRGLLALLDNTVPARRRPRAVLSVLSRIVAAATVFRGYRGEAEAAAPRLLDLVRGDHWQT
jgi:hypothetical protein